jgi:lysozyme family protein
MEMVEDFSGALRFVLNAEGGYSDDPDDPGGATNMGIEQTEYDAWLRGLGEETRSVRLIETMEASAIYKARYWDVMHGDYLPGALSYALFDTAVNTGCGNALSELQGVLGIPATGSFDNDTSAAYHHYFDAGRPVTELVDGILDRRTAYYHQIVIDNQRLSKFLDGWLRRINLLRLAIEQI